MANEGKPVEIGIAIAPLATLGAPGFGHQADLFVISDGLHLGAGATGQGSDRVHGALPSA